MSSTPAATILILTLNQFGNGGQGGGGFGGGQFGGGQGGQNNQDQNNQNNQDQNNQDQNQDQGNGDDANADADAGNDANADNNAGDDANADDNAGNGGGGGGDAVTLLAENVQAASAATGQDGDVADGQAESATSVIHTFLLLPHPNTPQRRRQLHQLLYWQREDRRSPEAGRFLQRYRHGRHPLAREYGLLNADLARAR